LEHKTPLLLDISELPFGISERSFELDKFSLPVKFKVASGINFRKYFFGILWIRVRRNLNWIKNRSSFHSTVVGFDPLFLRDPNFRSVRGYFQSWKYFFAVKDHFPNFKVEIKDPSPGLIACLALIEKDRPIAIHVRRGDYAKVSSEFGILNEDYFYNSLEFLKARRIDGKYWLFSDEPNFIQNNFSSIHFDRVPSVEFNLSDAESLYAMSMASNLIISNSTFSLWSGLIGNPKQNVLYPSPWFKTMETPEDLIPPHWKSIPSTWIS